jgi:hypothetical protein
MSESPEGPHLRGFFTSRMSIHAKSALWCVAGLAKNESMEKKEDERGDEFYLYRIFILSIIALTAALSVTFA